MNLPSIGEYTCFVSSANMAVKVTFVTSRKIIIVFIYNILYLNWYYITHIYKFNINSFNSRQNG